MHFYNFSRNNRRSRAATILRNTLFVIAVLAYLGALFMVIRFFS